MDYFGSIYHKSESDVLGKMEFVIDGIRKIVVLVLLMELVVQLQSGKQYEPYIKMLIGIMVVYSIVSGISGVLAGITSFEMAPMQEFIWSGDWDTAGGGLNEDDEGKGGIGDISSNVEEVHVKEIVIEEIKVKEIGTVGGAP